jgi:hypothetical protein
MIAWLLACLLACLVGWLVAWLLVVYLDLTSIQFFVNFVSPPGKFLHINMISTLPSISLACARVFPDKIVFCTSQPIMMMCTLMNKDTSQDPHFHRP